MTIETNITNRRELASALAQYLNTCAVYLGPPTFAYQIGNIHLSREGILSGNNLDGIFPFLEMQGVITVQPKQIQKPAENTAQNIQIPLEGYTPVNLRNLLSMLYSKQWLIRKAYSMPALHIPESAVNSMPTDTLESVVQSLLDLKAAGALTGIDIACEQITFSIDADADLEAVQTFLQHVVQSAKTATRVYSAYHPQENEKYIMHGWLIRLGLTGPEHKALRKSLMSNLRGNCAFRSATDAQAHRAKYARLRRELREAGETHGA